MERVLCFTTMPPPGRQTAGGCQILDGSLLPSGLVPEGGLSRLLASWSPAHKHGLSWLHGDLASALCLSPLELPRLHP